MKGVFNTPEDRASCGIDCACSIGECPYSLDWYLHNTRFQQQRMAEEWLEREQQLALRNALGHVAPDAVRAECMKEFRHNSPVAGMLCSVLRLLNDVGMVTQPYVSRDVLEWWREHKERDANKAAIEVSTGASLDHFGHKYDCYRWQHEPDVEYRARILRAFK